MPLSEHVAADYQTQRLSLKGHPMQFLRESLTAESILSCAAVNAAKNGAQVKTAGPVVFHSAPGMIEAAHAAGLHNVSQRLADDGMGKSYALYAVDLSR